MQCINKDGLKSVLEWQSNSRTWSWWQCWQGTFPVSVRSRRVRATNCLPSFWSTVIAMKRVHSCIKNTRLGSLDRALSFVGRWLSSSAKRLPFCLFLHVMKYLMSLGSCMGRRLVCAGDRVVWTRILVQIADRTCVSQYRSKFTFVRPILVQRPVSIHVSQYWDRILTRTS